jgi:hypothetical protein
MRSEELSSIFHLLSSLLRPPFLLPVLSPQSSILSLLSSVLSLASLCPLRYNPAMSDSESGLLVMETRNMERAPLLTNA